MAFHALRTVIVGVVAGVCASACQVDGPQATKARRVAPADPWSVTCADPLATSPAWLTNGQIGLRIGRDGSGWDHEGWVDAGPRGATPPRDDAGRKKLPFFAIDAYETTGEERILSLPSPLALDIRADGERLSPRKESDYWQTLDFRAGTLTTYWETPQMSVRVETMLDPEQRALGAKWTVEPRTSAAFEVAYTPPTWSAASPGREGDSFCVSFTMPPSKIAGRAQVRVRGQSNAEFEADPAGGRHVWRLRAGRDEPLMVEITATFGDDRAGVASARKLAIAGAQAPPEFEALETRRAAYMKTFWRTDIEIDGPVEDQQAVRSWLFHLRSALSPEGPMAVSPMGLSSGIYHGHVFWDADVWVFPALMLLDPERAAAIPRYRLNLFAAARENYRRWVAAGREIGTGPMGKTTPEAAGALMVPWESSVTGMETVPGPSRHQHHITGTAVLALEKAAMLGLADPEAVWWFGAGAAAFYMDRSEPQSGAERMIRSTMSPDEHHTGDNDLYTNLVAQRVIRRYGPEDQREVRFAMPRDGKGFLTYDGDTLRSYKQAAAVLAIYPLQDPRAEAEAREMMERFAGRVTKAGPAMSDSVHALIWARLGESDIAYTAWRKSWQDFSQWPLLLFSEKRSSDRSYFLTGAGGSLQAVMFGFLGARLDTATPKRGSAAIELRGGWLTFGPQLPTAWKSVNLKGLSVLGKNYDLKVTREKTQLTEGER